MTDMAVLERNGHMHTSSVSESAAAAATAPRTYDEREIMVTAAGENMTICDAQINAPIPVPTYAQTG